MDSKIYGNFNHQVTNMNTSSFDDKILRREALTASQKRKLGEDVSHLEKKDISTFFNSIISHLSTEWRDEYLINRANKYIEIKQNIQIIKLKSYISNLQQKNMIVGTRIDNLLKAIELHKDGTEREFNDLVCQLLWQITPTNATDAAVITNSLKSILASDKFSELLNKKTDLQQKGDMLNATLKLDVIPDKEIVVYGIKVPADHLKELYTTNNTQKKELVAKYIEPEKAALISLQAKEFPLVQNAISALKGNLEEWDELSLTLDSRNLDSLKDKIEQQLKNLTTLSDIISEISQNPEHSKALSVLNFSWMREMSYNPKEPKKKLESSLINTLKDCFAGEIDLSVKKLAVKKSIENNVKSLNQKLLSQGMDSFVNALRLNEIPQVPEGIVHINGRNYSSNGLNALYKRCNEAKKEFIAQNLAPEQIALISAQAAKFPLMQIAIPALRKTLEQWDDLVLRNDPSLDHLKAKIKLQMKNLTLLSNILNQLSQSEDNNRALSSLIPQEPEIFIQTLRSCFKGNNDLSRNMVEIFVTKTLQDSIESLKNELSQGKSPGELAEMRKNIAAVPEQADLHQAIREVKGWAGKQPTLTLNKEEDKSVNEVYPLNSPFTGQTAAFFKVGAHGEEAAGIMEKLMWNIAVRMGVKDQFVATGITEVRDQSQLTGGNEKARQWDAVGNLETFDEAKAPRIGGIQPAKGKTLRTVLKAGGNVARSEIVNGVLTSLVFGMFDAHGGNILITKEGKVKFFDNTRSLPNSNGFINRGYDVVSSYRCVLLELGNAKAPLSRQEIEELKQNIKEYKNNFADLNKYLHSKEGQAQLKKLPPGWMDLDASLRAMNQRINTMELLLKQGAVKTLEDLVIKSDPSYKLAYAMTNLELLHRGINGPIHEAIGFYGIQETINTLTLKGIDFQRIKSWCDEPNISLDELSNRINWHYRDVWYNPPWGTELQKRQYQNDQIKRQICANASEDYKDIARSTCVENKNFDLLRQNGVEKYYDSTPQNIENAINYAKRYNLRAVLVGEDGNWKLIQSNPAGYRVKGVDISSKPGFIREKTFDSYGNVQFGNEMKIDDFLNSLLNPSPPKFEELPILSSQLTYELTLQKGMVVQRGSNNTLVISIRTRDRMGRAFMPNPYRFAAGQNGKFLVRADPWLGMARDSWLTIDQIQNLCGRSVDRIT